MDPISVGETLSACEAVLGNAAELVEEAELLLAHHHFARALTLAHLASEELSKLPILYTVAIQEVRGQAIDWRQVSRVMNSHPAKIREAQLMDYLRTPHSEVNEALRELLDALRQSGMTNDLKNRSLYTSQSQGQFQRPSEVISQNAAKAFVQLARERLQAAIVSEVVLQMATGGTEAGLRMWVKRPEFEGYARLIESHAPDPGGRPSREEALARLSGLLNHPEIRRIQTEVAQHMNALTADARIEDHAE